MLIYLSPSPDDVRGTGSDERVLECSRQTEVKQLATDACAARRRIDVLRCEFTFLAAVFRGPRVLTKSSHRL